MAEQHRLHIWWLCGGIYIGGFPCKAFSFLVGPKTALLGDPRAKPFFKVIDTLAACQPMIAILENVIGFLRVKERALELLSGVGAYFIHIVEIDPLAHGWPGQRRRVYIIMVRCDVASATDRPQWERMLVTTLHNLKQRPQVQASSLLHDGDMLRSTKKLRRQEDFDEATLTKKPRLTALELHGRWLQTHWDFMQENGLQPKDCWAAMPHQVLSRRGAHIVGIWRTLCRSKGLNLSIINVSQSVHRVAGLKGACRDIFPCITPHGQFWVDSINRCMSPAEKLLAMGLPIHKMDVGVLSNCEMEEMAGNAMHCWVPSLQSPWCKSSLLSNRRVVENCVCVCVCALPGYWDSLAGGIERR